MDPTDVSTPDGHSKGANAQAPAERKDIAYGQDPEQQLDVYSPGTDEKAPIFFMVHGGAWRIGDKGARGVVENKRRRWVGKGYLMVSVNYRMKGGVDPITQAEDVALALAFVQKNAESWGGDPGRIVVIGHSSGAHLVSLLASDPSLRKKQGALPWKGTVALDSAAYDVQKIMRSTHMRFYDRVFGVDPEFWRAASPFHRLKGLEAPFLAICSSERDDSCPQAAAFVEKAKQMGGEIKMVAVAKSHKEINEDLGEPGEYTEHVASFLRSVALP